MTKDSSSETNLSRIRRDLQKPEVFPVETSSVEIVETHISLVFMTDTRVYKVKKPVQFPFLDYSTLEQRRWFCEEEIRLNRRLAPEVYLDVRSIAESEAGLRVGGTGSVVDYCVEMERLPDSAILKTRILQGDLRDEEVDRVVDRLVAFYRELPRDPKLQEYATPEVFEQAVRENVDTLLENVPADWQTLIRRIRSSQIQFVRLAGDLFRKRQLEGHIVEGHGDLRPEHVCLLDPPVVFDCVEFSLPFRVCDMLNEMAFLAMECDVLGDHSLGERMLTRFAARMGDSFPHALVGFYKAYRATIRAKVEQLRSLQETGDSAKRDSTFARRYLQLAVDYASSFHQPIGIVTIGVSGSGKSTLAAALAENLGAEVVRTDAVRQELAGRRQKDADIGAGIYSAEMTERTYDAVIEQGAAHLQAGVSVVLDGSFLDPATREKALRMSQEVGSALLFVQCALSVEAAQERVRERRASGEDISDARAELVPKQAEALASAEDLRGLVTIEVDTSKPVQDCVEAVLARLAGLVRPPAI